MEKILFEGYNKTFKKWFYGDLVYGTINSANRIVGVGIKPIGSLYALEVDPETVKQLVRKDKHGLNIFEGNRFRFQYLEELHKPIELIGKFNWNDDELRYEIEVEGHEKYVCLSFVGNGMFSEFELITERSKEE